MLHSFQQMWKNGQVTASSKLTFDIPGTKPRSTCVEVVIAPPKSVRRKPPNLITDTITSPPVKPPVFRSSGNGEGNFVKMNLNGKRGKGPPNLEAITHSEGRDTENRKPLVTANHYWRKSLICRNREKKKLMVSSAR
ncbi:hypothetical protein ISN45_Un198g000010 [Arabidopsis thaliana x Arabidopsis arenosa]|uniref:Uncharacterized protein n=1 Tax=Arabidopsis thaliana x Arabidopsis arenosa TaxID=1240361 RepID=A0A8T1XFS1_9BRAS|nr:hypothetical protein ISN45_Un198g000010 [Arabidopsis thaliana x Arabidopsis arenosa]